MSSSRNACLAAARLFAVAAVLLWLPSCGSSGGGTTTGSGGDTGSGGSSDTGGAKGTGGATSTGGTPGTGGMPATGGTIGTGGTAATGGSNGTGGVKGTGGTPATGGTIGTGGTGATGGSGGTAGLKGTGGTPATGGAGGAATGGSPGTGGSATAGSSGTCPATSNLKVGDNNESITSQGGSPALSSSVSPRAIRGSRLLQPLSIFTRSVAREASRRARRAGRRNATASGASPFTPTRRKRPATAPGTQVTAATTPRRIRSMTFSSRGTSSSISKPIPASIRNASMPAEDPMAVA